MNPTFYRPYFYSQNIICRYLIVILFFTLQINPATVYAAEKSIAEEEMGNAGLEDTATKMPSQSRDKAVGEQIESNLRTGEAHWLGAGDEQFLAIYTPYTPHHGKKAEGAILLLHDLGANADWPQLIMPLREQLAENGWDTLSLQFPMLNSGEEKKEFLRSIDTAIARINTAVEFLEQQETKRVVIVGHGFGAATGALYLTQNPEAPISAFVGLSLTGADSLKYSEPVDAVMAAPQTADPPPDVEGVDQPEKAPQNKTQKQAEPEEPALSANNAAELVANRDFFAELQKLKLPFLDIFAEQDHIDVTRDAEKRAKLMRQADIKVYLQIKLDGADHYFIGHEVRLIKRIRGWLRKYARP